MHFLRFRTRIRFIYERSAESETLEFGFGLGFGSVSVSVRFRCIYVAAFMRMGNQSKKESKDQESIQSSNLPDPGYQWESDNFTIRHHKREPRGQPFPSR